MKRVLAGLLAPVMIATSIILPTRPAQANTNMQNACKEFAYEYAMNFAGRQWLSWGSNVIAGLGLVMQFTGTVIAVRQDEAAGLQQIAGGILISTGSGLASLEFSSENEAARAAAAYVFSKCKQAGYL